MATLGPPSRHLVGLWRPRTVSRVTVATPFVGQQVGEDDPVLARLGELSMARGVEDWLVVPEEPSAEDTPHQVVPLPQSFGRSWQRRFGRRGGALVVPVPLHVQGDGKHTRQFHSKAVLLQGDRHDLLMVGSSNCTPHGKGVGAFKAEANLAFEDMAETKHEGMTFDDRLGPGMWWEECVGVDDLVWQETDETPEDVPPGRPNLPALFAWASPKSSASPRSRTEWAVASGAGGVWRAVTGPPRQAPSPLKHTVCTMAEANSPHARPWHRPSSSLPCLRPSAEPTRIVR